MIKNKAMKALIVGTCLMVSTVSGVYADTNNVEVKPAIVEQQATDDSKMMEIQILSATEDNALTQKQKEIDEYVFEKHADEILEKGITITHTGVVGEAVEVGITPYDAKSADYLYSIFGKDMVIVVEGEQAVPLQYVTLSPDGGVQEDELIYASGAAQEDASFFERIFNSIVEWFKGIFQ
ncbi:MAG: hypothetical protein K0Q99_1490 [Clostridia bacterium]|jgi:hypothetical protein|nr:hypothetical protein [Clostridia bacterium]